MFSNKLIRSLCRSSDEDNLKLSPMDWALVLGANKNFTETEGEFRGNGVWGHYLISKVEKAGKLLAQPPSLELCSGNGFLFLSLREFLPLEDSEHYFVDISMNQCRQFKRRTTQNVGKRIICGDIGRLPFKDNYFRSVYGNSFLHHLPDVPYYLKETNRVLFKGGVFIVMHEPTHTAPFFESFPLSLVKDTRTDSLTDIWAISPQVISKLLYEAGFSKVTIIPAGLISSLLVTPFQIMVNKLAPGKSNSNFFARLRIACDQLDKLIPRSVRLKFSPSLAFCAEK